MFREIEILSPDECERACKSIHVLRRYWVQQHPKLSTYTLGASIGNCYDWPTYREEAARCNPPLKLHFTWLYERLAERMSETFGEPFTLTEAFAVPGFVLYMAPANIPKMKPPIEPPIHRDLQFHNLPWNHYYKDVHLDTAMSSTGSLRLPKGGSGLDWWYLTPEQCAEKGLDEDASPEEIAQESEQHYHKYTQGHMVILPNVMPHRAALQEFEGGDQRITLQVHYVYADGAWRMYF